MSSIPPSSPLSSARRPMGLATPSPRALTPPGIREQVATDRAPDHHAALLNAATEKLAALPQAKPAPTRPAARTTLSIFNKSVAKNPAAHRTAEMDAATALLDTLLRERHETYVNAMAPRTVDEAKTMLRAFLNFPDISDFRAAAEAAVSSIGGDQFANEMRAFGDKQRAEAAFVKRTNVWTADKPLAKLLAPSRLTDSDHPEIGRQVRVILQGKQLVRVLEQQNADGTRGEPAEIAGIDGVMYTAETLAKHPQWGDLLEGNNLWKALHDDDMEALLANPDKAMKNFTPQTLDRLAMAQRIASVAIHYTVRDSIKYGLGAWRQSASQVLRLRQGSCSGSANVATALARAANLPAGVVITWVELPHYFYVIMTPNVLPTRERTSVHADTAYVMLDKDKDGYRMAPVRGDASDEAQLAANAVHDNHPTTHVVHFNGGSDKLLRFADPFVYDHAGPILNVDPMLDKTSSVPPAAAERWLFLHYMGKMSGGTQADPTQVAARFANDAESLVLTAFAEIYEAFGKEVKTYRDIVKDVVSADAVTKVFLDKTGSVFGDYLNTEAGAQAAATEPFDQEAFYQGLTAFESRRGVPSEHMPTMTEAAPAIATVMGRLEPFFAANPALRGEFGQCLDVCAKHEQSRRFGETAEQRTVAFAQMHDRTYRFMTQCYPTERSMGAGPDEMRRYLDQPTQTAYMQWLQSLAAKTQDMPAMFGEQVDTALAFLVKDDPRGLFDPKTLTLTRPMEEVMTLAGIDAAALHKVADFHGHLLSNISAEVMNRFLEYGRKQGAGIRLSLDGAEMFEQWLTDNYPTLAQFHRDELNINPEYPHAMAMYAFMRLPMNLPGPAEKTLASFVAHVESFSERPFTNEDDLDEMFADYLKGVRRDASADPGVASQVAPEHTPIDAFKSHAQGGGAKPFGVLYSLVKAYILLPEEQRRAAISRLVEAGEANATKGPQRIDRFV